MSEQEHNLHASADYYTQSKRQRYQSIRPHLSTA